MQIIRSHFHHAPESKKRILLKIERRKLAKRRFREVAEDGVEFGFDLEHPLKNGDFFHQDENSYYVIAQTAEPVLRIPYTDADQAALYGWMIGNMHFPAAFADQAILAEDDPAVRQLLERAQIDYTEVTAVFQPPSVAANAHHHH